jgi:hypothetical protein
MELSPFKSITGSDTFWDGSIPNPLSVGIPISVSQTTPETSVAGLRNRKYYKVTWGYWKDYQENLTKDRKGHKENQDELGTEMSKEDKAKLGTLSRIGCMLWSLGQVPL